MAYWINDTFYHQHFVWCSPVFDTSRLDSLDKFKKIPPSSNPYTVYQRFVQDVKGEDLHSNCISFNKAGLKKGAIHMLNYGIIDKNDFARINQAVDAAGISQFLPLLYIIPKKKVEKRIIEVPVDQAANPLSFEFQIADLKKNEFEAIEY